MVDDEDITNLHREEDRRNFMIKDQKLESWEEVGYNE